MRLIRIAREGARALATHKLRTFFMMTGTVVGIASLTVIMALGKGTQREVMARVNSFGTRLIKISAGGGKGYTRPQAGVVTLKMADADAIRSEIRGWDIVTSVAQKSKISTKAGNRQTDADVFAVDADWHEAMEWPAKEGAQIEAEDLATMNHVCVLGTRLAEALFGDEDPVGTEIQIGSVRFRIKGTLIHHPTSPAGDDENNRAVIPLTTGLRRLFNQDHLSYIRVRMKDAKDVPAAAEQIRQLIHERHHITPPEQDDFSIVTAKEVADAVKGVSTTLAALLEALTILGLVVGGVVLMNILLISVGERTKEIGLRRALGATYRDIFLQFLTESLTVCLWGMILGCGLGWLLCIVLAQTTKLLVVVSWEPFAMAAVFALLVGTFFGVQPARRAAQLHPVEALK